jgi:hypothetical protein
VGWCAHSRKYLEDPDVADAIDNKIVARSEPGRRQDVAAESDGIVVDALLAEILEGLSCVRIATQPRDLAAQVVAESGASPAKGFGNSRADR